MANKIKNAFTAGTDGVIQGALEQALNSAVGALSPLNNYSRYMSGARAIIKVNGKVFGFAFGVNYEIKTDYVENFTIDDYTAYELMPSRITISGTLGMFHIPGKGPTAELVQANLLSYLFHRYITLEISDQMTGQILFRTNRAMITSKSQSLSAGELSTIQLQWKAIGWADEKVPMFPQGYQESDPDSSAFGKVPSVDDFL